MAQPKTIAARNSCDWDKFQCPFCVAAFKSSVGLQAHAVYSHRIGFYTCAWCTALIENESKIQEHAKTCTRLAKHEVKMYILFKFISISIQVRVNNSRKNKFELQEAEFDSFCIIGSSCDICESSFPSDMRAIKHYKEIHLHCIYICGSCVKYFQKKENFDSHCANEHEHSNESQPSASVALQMEKMPISDRSASDKLKLVREFNEKRCIDCNISFPNVAEISKHFLVEHQFKMHVCTECERGYTHKASLDVHPCRSINQRPLNISNDSFKYRMNLMREFNKKRCLDCKIIFASVAEISDHFQAEHFRVHLCKGCNRGFMEKRLLNKHQCNRVKMLKGFREMRCSCCEITFENTKESQEHFRMKHRLKILVCKKCNYATTTEKSLKFHPCLRMRATKKEKENPPSPAKSIKKEQLNVSLGCSDASSTQRKTMETINHQTLVRIPVAERRSNRNSRKSHDRSVNETNSYEAPNSCATDDRKHPCNLCPYDLPTYLMGLNHYAEEHDVCIFECPAPHCFQLFRRFSKWSRHFLNSHGNVELPEGSEFRTLLDDIVSDWNSIEKKYHDSFVTLSLLNSDGTSLQQDYCREL